MKIYIKSNFLSVKGQEFPCSNNTNLDSIHPVELQDSKEIKDTTEFEEGWFVEDFPILPINRKNVIYVPRPYFESLMEILDTRGFWEAEIELG